MTSRAPKASVLLYFVVPMLLVASCAPIARPDIPSTPPATPTMESAGTVGEVASVRVGEKFHVVLDGNPTTGYNWYVQDIDTAIVEQVGESTFTPVLKLPGAGGMVSTTFRGVAPGHTTVTMVYERSFEANSTLQTYTISVIVR